MQTMTNCPFCNAIPDDLEIINPTSIPVHPTYVKCGKCRAKGPHANSAKTAIARWDALALSPEEKTARMAEIDKAEPNMLEVAYWDGETMPELEED